ncbi:MAG: hypothetical protein JNM19_17565 [Chitinophagaceae bacterium]|nr:hypothetical protein [Chitinophagaceae bacterium]
MKRKFLTWLTAMTLAVATNAQVKVGDNPTALDPNAVLEMESTTKGMMLPRMTAAQRDAIASPSNSMLIFNTTENCINVYNGAVGSWKSLCGDEASGSAEFTADCSSLLVTGTYTTGVALNPSNNFLTVNVDVSTLGTYNILASSAGMYFAASGAFTTLGTQTITLSGQGYPLVSGVNFLALNINGELCTTVINVSNGIATITGCGTVGALTGSLIAGTAIEDNSVYQSYTAGPAYTGGGVFGITSATSNGIRIASPVNGSFTGSGDPIDYFLTGTPVIPGNTTVNFSINAQPCSFTVPVRSGTGFASAVNCSGSAAGTYTVGTAMNGSNTKGVSLTVTTIGTFNVQTNTVNGIYFAGSATAATAGALNITLTAVGTPTEAITGTYTVTISNTATTFITCTFNVTAVLPVVVPSFTSLSCSSLGMSASGGVNYIKASNPSAGDYFGGKTATGDGIYPNSLSISADGLTMAVGAPYEDGDLTGGAINSTNNAGMPNSGAVYVYTRPNKQTNWSQQAKIKPTQLGTGDVFGASVRLSDNGNTLIVGSPSESGSGTGINPAHNDGAPRAGAAYVFTRSGSTWSQQAYLKASNSQQEDFFGTAVAISADGNTAAVGAFKEDGSGTGVNPVSNEGASASGAVYVFIRSGSVWSQEAYIKASNTGLDDLFGTKLSLSSDGNTLAVSAIGEDGGNSGVNPASNNSLSSSGAVYVFVRSGSLWSQQAYLKAMYPVTSGSFGSAVSLSSDGNTIAIGSVKDNSSGTGVNAINNNSATGSGAAYIYTRSGSIWGSGIYIKAPDTRAGDGFGHTISISKDGNTLAVGANNEASSATCINGTDDNTGTKIGAVYLYHKASGNWISTFKVHRPSGMGNQLSLRFGLNTDLDGTGNTLAVSVGYEDGPNSGINPAYGTTSTDSGAVVTYTKN